MEPEVEPLILENRYYGSCRAIVHYPHAPSAVRSLQSKNRYEPRRRLRRVCIPGFFVNYDGLAVEDLVRGADLMPFLSDFDSATYFFAQTV